MEIVRIVILLTIMILKMIVIVIEIKMIVLYFCCDLAGTYFCLIPNPLASKSGSGNLATSTSDGIFDRICQYEFLAIVLFLKQPILFS